MKSNPNPRSSFWLKLALQIPALRSLVQSNDELVTALESARQRVVDLEHYPAALLKLEQDTASMRLAQAQNRMFITDYAYFPESRPMAVSAGGQRIQEIFKQHEQRMRQTLLDIAQFTSTLTQIPRTTQLPLQPCWDNPWFPPFDGVALYGLLALHKPRRYIEVGSGISTRFARQAIQDFQLATTIISIDPHPHNPVEGLCDEVIVQRAENMPQEFWQSLSANDMVFIDNSHRSFPGSDVTVFFTEVLPSLPSGVIYGIHDIFLPNDYPTEWNERFYSEQYLLMLYLLGGAANDEILLPVNWLTGQAHLHGLLSGLWQHPGLFDGMMMHGGAFWARRA
jgi:predicted O-methyltransferase YrrM